MMIRKTKSISILLLPGDAVLRCRIRKKLNRNTASVVVAVVRCLQSSLPLLLLLQLFAAISCRLLRTGKDNDNERFTRCVQQLFGLLVLSSIIMVHSRQLLRRKRDLPGGTCCSLKCDGSGCLIERIRIELSVRSGKRLPPRHNRFFFIRAITIMTRLPPAVVVRIIDSKKCISSSEWSSTQSKGTVQRR